MERTSASSRQGSFTVAAVAAVLAGPILCLAAAFIFPVTALYDKGIYGDGSRIVFDLLFFVSIVAYAASCCLLPALSGGLKWLIIAAPVISGVIMLFFDPLNSTDIYDAIFRARISTHFGGNPFIDIPLKYLSDPLLPFVSWYRTTSPYGPLWELLAYIPSKLAGDSLLANIFAFKLTALVFWAMCSGLVVAIARQICANALRAYFIFAACPITLFEAIGNGHNDLTMVAPLLLAYLFLLRGWLWAAIPALSLAVLVKYIPILLVPLVVVYSWKRFGSRATLRGLGVGVLISGGMVVACYAPFWQGLSSLAPLQRGALFNNSFAAAGVLAASNMGMDLQHARTVALATSLLVTLGLVLWQIRSLWQAAENKLNYTLFESSTDLLAYFMAYALIWWQPWYVLWLVPFIALRPEEGRLTILIAFLTGALIVYTINPLDKTKFVGTGDYENWVAVIIFLPILAVLGWKLRGSSRH